MCTPVSSFVQQRWITVFVEYAETSWGKSIRQEKVWQQAACRCQRSRHLSVEIKGCWTRTRLPRVRQPKGSPRLGRGPSRSKEMQKWQGQKLLAIYRLTGQHPAHPAAFSSIPNNSKGAAELPFLGRGIQRHRTNHSQGDAGVASCVLLTDSDLCHMQSVWACQRGADLLCKCEAALLNICSSSGRVLVVSSSFPEYGWGATRLFLLLQVVST